MAKKMRLRENHPTMKKLEELITKAEELGLTLDFESGVCTLTDSAGLS
jgi:hypothetical protein